MPQGNPKAGELYLHFKNKRYQVLGTAIHSETRERMVIYQALYGDYGTYVRPYDMFISEVDHEKYPQVEQKYRFEYKGRAGENMPENEPLPVQNDTTVQTENEEPIPEEVQQETAEEEMEPLPAAGLMEFLDADTYAEKYRILRAMSMTDITDSLIDNLSASLDVVIPEGDVDTRFVQLKNAVATYAKYETTRLR